MSEWIVSSSVLIILLVFIRCLFRRRLALRVRYALWLAAVVRLLIPASFSESSFSVLNLLNSEHMLMLKETADGWINEQNALLKEKAASEGVDREKRQDGYVKGGNEGENRQDGYVKGGNESENRQDGYVQGGNESENRQDGYVKGGNESENRQDRYVQSGDIQFGRVEFGSKGEAGSGTDARHSDLSNVKSNPLYLVWLWGMALCAGIVLGTNINCRKRIYRTRKEYRTDGDSVLPVYVSPVVSSPCMFGLLHPAVYLPVRAEKERDELRYILSHENTHYKHRDNIWAIIRTVCICVHWYNPFVWLAAYLSRQDCELACDEEVLEQLGKAERVDYGRTLLAYSVQGNKLLGSMQISTTMSGGKKQLKERLLMIMERPERYVSSFAAALMLEALVLMITFTGKKPVDDIGNPVNTGIDLDMGGNLYKSSSVGNISGRAFDDLKVDLQSDNFVGGSLQNEDYTDALHYERSVSIDLSDGKDYELKISGETIAGSNLYTVNQIELSRRLDGAEEILQSIYISDVKVLYTKASQDVTADESSAWPWLYSSDGPPLFAKPLYSAKDLPVYAVGRFENTDAGQILTDRDDGILIMDLNFDGYDDFCLRAGPESANIPYYCYLWNPEAGRFEYSYMIPNVQVDEEAQLIVSAVEDGGGVHSVKYYHFDQANILHMVRYVEENSSPDAVFPTLDLTYCEGGYYDLPAVDEWDYGARYSGALTERLVCWAKKALEELYDYSGTKIDMAFFKASMFGTFYFANSEKDMQASRIYYQRTYGAKAGFEECIEDMFLATERVVWYSNVTQWNVPENLQEMTDSQVVEWYFGRSPLAEGENMETIEERDENSYFVRTISGKYYIIYFTPSTREVSDITGPYYSDLEH